MRPVVAYNTECKMKKYVLALVLFFGLTGLSFAEETATAPAANDSAVSAPAAVTAEAPAPTADAVSPEVVEAPMPAATPASAESATATPAAPAENLEFISGEVSAVDEANKSVTVKLYGETENTPGDKSITVMVEKTTDITDGEKDRDLKSLTNGTEVDVEYDPASNKATYIFVY